MNLSAYDVVNPNINKQKTWYNALYKAIFSREIRFRPYWLLVQRESQEGTDYFLVVTEDKSKAKGTCRHDDFGRVKIFLDRKDVITLGLMNVTDDIPITLEQVDVQSDCNIYRFVF